MRRIILVLALAAIIAALVVAAGPAAAQGGSGGQCPTPGGQTCTFGGGRVFPDDNLAGGDAFNTTPGGTNFATSQGGSGSLEPMPDGSNLLTGGFAGHCSPTPEGEEADCVGGSSANPPPTN